MLTREPDPQPEGYEPFFGLREAPFGLAPDPRFLFASASHSAALAQVTYALERREPLVVVTGEIGTGKTLLCRTVLQRLERKTFLSVINDPLLERDELLKQLLQDFGVIPKSRTAPTAATRHDLAETLHAFLQSLVPIHAHAVVIIDEAQHLQPDVLEQIRLLSNTGDEHGTLLQIILVGQTDLETLMSRPELRQMQQRVSRRLRLEPLTSGEVREYIEHRIALARDSRRSGTPGAAELSQALAEWRGPTAEVEFMPDAIDAILQFSGGLPRVINLLCDRSLEQAHVFRLHAIDGPLIHMAARALGLHAQPAPAPAPAMPSAAQNAPAASEKPSELFASSIADESPHSAAASDREASFSGFASSGSEQPADAVRESAEEGLAEPSAAAKPVNTPRWARGLALAASVVLAAAIWFGVRTVRRPAPPASPGAAQGSPATSQANAPAEPEPTLTIAPALPETTPTAPNSKPAATAAPSEAAAVDHFDIVVASFRTDARAATVASEVSTLGLPVRRRLADGWQQIICGPFTSRTDAEQAQQRLEHGGLTGTQIVPAAR
ncbi:MAG TPA: AAA family ATPase [Vicinamibacterales bacterium]|nr:AAA family ATPase [Vicinamibacterales bacterium]